MNVTPRSIAPRMMARLSVDVCDENPMCQPPRPMAETRSPVRPSVRYNMSCSWRRRRAQDDRRLVRAIAAAAADRLHRSLLDALLGSPHADRRDDARARRPGVVGESALRRLLGLAGVEGRAGADDRRVPRLGAAGRAADRILAARADGRRRADSDGAGDGPRRDAVVAVEE